MSVLEIEDLAFSYGKTKVLQGLTLSVPKNSVFGFVGQNGAGKTTAMKAVLGLLKPAGGSITVCGERVEFGRAKTNRHVGYLPDVPEFYPYMRPMEYLDLCGGIAGMEKRDIRERGARALELVGLRGESKRLGGFSRGMKQRMGIAQALLHSPELLICDEPTSALDPMGRKDILEILSSVRGQATVLFSTHVLSDVERICDRVAVLHGGKTALCGTLGELKARRRREGFTVELASAADADALQSDAELTNAGARIDRDGQALSVAFKDESGGRLLMGALARLGIVPARMEKQEPTLESLFLEAVG